MSFGWCQGKWYYRNKLSGELILVTEIDGKEAAVQHYSNTAEKNVLGVQQSTDGAMNNQFKVMTEKAKYWIRRITSYPIKFHISWQIPKGGIFHYLAYTLPVTMISRKQGDRIFQALY